MTATASSSIGGSVGSSAVSDSDCNIMTNKIYPISNNQPLETVELLLATAVSANTNREIKTSTHSNSKQHRRTASGG